jgi:hypothetical protein
MVPFKISNSTNHRHNSTRKLLLILHRFLKNWEKKLAEKKRSWMSIRLYIFNDRFGFAAKWLLKKLKLVELFIF